MKDTLIREVMQDKAAELLEEMNISGDTMVDVDMSQRGGAMYVYDLMAAFYEHMMEQESTTPNPPTDDRGHGPNSDISEEKSKKRVEDIEVPSIRDIVQEADTRYTGYQVNPAHEEARRGFIEGAKWCREVIPEIQPAARPAPESEGMKEATDMGLHEAKEKLADAYMGDLGHATRENQRKAFDAIIEALTEIIVKLEKLESQGGQE